MPDYRTVQGSSTYTYEEKRSRFIAQASFADTEEMAAAVLGRVKSEHHAARHHVYAYVLRAGERTRCSDDGEPAKTAGVPVLEAILHAGVSDVIVVVTRYFGGVLLGTGGLVRAYSAAASGALQAARIVTMRKLVECSVTLPYALYEPARRLLAEGGAREGEARFADAVTLTWHIPAEEHGALCAQIEALARGKAAVKVGSPFFAPF